MKVSGFSFCRNAINLYYPVAESIRSVLPLVDEFVIAVGRSEDGTLDLVRSIGDPKIRIIETQWDEESSVRGSIYADQTNLALDACRGDWRIYIQADEVLHEDDYPLLRQAMRAAQNRPDIEGLLLDYLHFWGSYERYQNTRDWYRREIRVVRGGLDVRSWRDAQGFRIDGRKMRVVRTGARVFHYGWVRPPRCMKRKNIVMDTLYHDREAVRELHPEPDVPFDYGPLEHLAHFTETHPGVMRERILGQDWELPPPRGNGSEHGHNRAAVRALSWIERKVLRTRIGEYRNYVLVR